MNFRNRIAVMVLLARVTPYDPGVQGDLAGWKLYDRQWEQFGDEAYRLRPKEENLVGTISGVVEENGEYYAVVDGTKYNVSKNVLFGPKEDREVHKLFPAPNKKQPEVSIAPQENTELQKANAKTNFRKIIESKIQSNKSL